MTSLILPPPQGSRLERAALVTQEGECDTELSPASRPVRAHRPIPRVKESQVSTSRLFGTTLNWQGAGAPVSSPLTPLVSDGADTGVPYPVFLSKDTAVGVGVFPVYPTCKHLPRGAPKPKLPTQMFP